MLQQRLIEAKLMAWDVMFCSLMPESDTPTPEYISHSDSTLQDTHNAGLASSNAHTVSAAPLMLVPAASFTFSTAVCSTCVSSMHCSCALGFSDEASWPKILVALTV